MARTPLLRAFLALVREQRAADAHGVPLEALRERRARALEGADPSLTRRSFLAGAAAGTGVLLTGCPSAGPGPVGPVAPGAPDRPPPFPKGKQPKIVVIGAGIAGLAAALELSDAKIPCTVYEAATRTGGRMYSNTTYFDEGQVFEIYGELIDTPHTAVRALAKRFEIPIDDLVVAQPAGAHETYHFFGKHYPREDAERDVAAMKSVFLDEIRRAGEDITYDSTTPHGVTLDNMSVYDWIEKRVPDGHRSPLGALLDTAYYIELNADTREQSALNIVYAFGSQPAWEHFDMYGVSDERLKTRGGNQRITDAMAAALPEGTLQLGARMESIVRRSSGDYELSVRRGGVSQSVIADYVILTLPFAVLRDMDYSKAGFDELKHKAIQELGRGRQSKQHLQFKQRVWYDKGVRPYPGTGTSYSDTGYQVTWEATRGQKGQSGILVAYCGGPNADKMSSKVAVATANVPEAVADAKRFLEQGEPVFPGLKANWNGKCIQGIPHLDPNFKCSYSHWRIGQYQSIRGYERVSQGRVLFAGEHTSTEFQGFMEGGAVEGQRAAREVIASLT